MRDIASRVEIHYISTPEHSREIRDFLLTPIGLEAVLDKAKEHDHTPKCQERWKGAHLRPQCGLLAEHEGQHTVENWWGFDQALVWE